MEDSVGRAPTHEDMRELTETQAAQQGKADKLGDKRTQRFLNHYPEVKTMRGRRLEAVRRKGSTHTNVVDFFAIYKRYMDKYKVTPSHIYNMDETGFDIGVSTNGNDITLVLRGVHMSNLPKSAIVYLLFSAFLHLGLPSSQLSFSKRRACGHTLFLSQYLTGSMRQMKVAG